MDSVRWGIIGCGDVCEVKSGPAFQKAEGSELVAVMRRDAGKRNPLVLFDMDAPDAARLSAHAFSALWGASVPVPERHLVAGGNAKPSGAYERTQDDAPITALRRDLQGWPLVRH